MIFTPEKCRIPDQRMKNFIDPDEIWDYINNTNADKARVTDIIAKSLDKKRLTLEETAVLINATDPELIAEKYDHLVDIVIDSGYGDNVASTIVDLTSGEPEIIRQGKGEI